MELKALRKHGWTISALAREFGLSRNTVKRELASDAPRGYPERDKPTELTPSQRAHVERRLAVCPTIRGTDLHYELQRHYDYVGSYRAFSRHLMALRPPEAKDPEIRFETGPGIQTQADWAHLGLWPLGDSMAELHTMVAILGFSRAPAIRFAIDCTRATSFQRLVHCFDDLGGVTREVLTDRDTAFCIGSTSDGKAILSPEWVDLAALLDLVPKACRPYRAKTKGKVERMVRELKESFVPWLTGQVLPVHPTVRDYDDLARQWIEERVLPRKHRTTQRFIGEAWQEERQQLRPVPARILAGLIGGGQASLPAGIIDLEQHALGAHAQVRDLAEYQVAL
jgi:transposase